MGFFFVVLEGTVIGFSRGASDSFDGLDSDRLDSDSSFSQWHQDTSPGNSKLGLLTEHHESSRKAALVPGN